MVVNIEFIKTMTIPEWEIFFFYFSQIEMFSQNIHLFSILSFRV